MGVKKNIYTRLVIGTLLLVATTAYAQENRYISVSATPGFLLAHRADIKNLAAHNYGIDISYEKQQYSTAWGQHYRKPCVGYGMLYHNLGRLETGHALGLFSHVKLNVLTLGNTDIRFRMGAGLAYLTQKFDVYTNRRNQAIGSHLNGSMQFGLVARKELKNKTYVESGLSISHYSNAAFKVPNLGYNIPSLTLRYGFATHAQPVTETIPSNKPTKIDWTALLIYGKKQRNFANPKDFYNWGLQLRGIRHLSPVKAWRFGIDYTLDKTYKYSEDPLFPSDEIPLAEQSEVALAGGFQWGFGKTTVIAEMGAYLYKPAILKNPLSQRMGIGYAIQEHWSVQGTLRFHRGVADFFELGMGYTL